MLELPAAAGIGKANWNWRVVCRFVSERFGISLSRSICLNYPRLHDGGSAPLGVCPKVSQEAAGQGG